MKFKGTYFGIVYINLFVIDAALSGLGTLMPLLEKPADYLSTFNLFLSLLVPLGIHFKFLKPKRLFWMLAGLYYLVFILNIFLAVSLESIIGPEINWSEITLSFIMKTIPWYGPVHYGIIVIMFILAFYALATYKKYNKDSTIINKS